MRGRGLGARKTTVPQQAPARSQIVMKRKGQRCLRTTAFPKTRPKSKSIHDISFGSFILVQHSYCSAASRLKVRTEMGKADECEQSRRVHRFVGRIVSTICGALPTLWDLAHDKTSFALLMRPPNTGVIGTTVLGIAFELAFLPVEPMLHTWVLDDSFTRSSALLFRISRF